MNKNFSCIRKLAKKNLSLNTTEKKKTIFTSFFCCCKLK